MTTKSRPNVSFKKEEETYLDHLQEISGNKTRIGMIREALKLLKDKYE